MCSKISKATEKSVNKDVMYSLFFFGKSLEILTMVAITKTEPAKNG